MASNTMTRRRFLRAFAAGAGASLLAACESPPRAGGGTAQPTSGTQAPAQVGRSLLFVWLPKDAANPVFEPAKVGGETRAAELAIDFRWVASEKPDAEEQAQLMGEAIDQGCDGIGISCNNPEILRPVIDRAVDAGIPVITWDSDSPQSKRSTFYGADNTKAAQRAAELFVEAMKENQSRTYAILTGVPGAANLEERIRAFREVADRPENGLQWIATDPCNDDVALGAQIVENRMGANPDLGGWFMAGSWPLFGDVNAMPQLVAAKGRTKIVAWDTRPEQLPLVKDGLVQALIGQKYYGWGYDAVGILHDIVSGTQSYPSFVDSSFDVVQTPEEADAYLQKWETKDFR